MTTLDEWARRWSIPAAAITDLRASLLLADAVPPSVPGISEAAVQAQTRVEASRLGWRLWRNNVGAFHDHDRGVHVRFGLANDSPQVNAVVKSGDLIGVRPVLITPAHVGRTLGQFVSVENKHGAWRWSGNDHEQAQERWALLVRSLGGAAGFVRSAAQLGAL